MPSRRGRPTTGWLVAALLCLAGCRPSDAPGRVMVLGLDGLDPDAVELLAGEGRLPHLAALRRAGAGGRLRSQRPLLSPILWTTIATGRTPDVHRIGDFVALDRASGEPRPVTSRMRAVKALWNIASEHDRRVAVVGWWATWPPEPVRGAVVSDHACYHFLFAEGLHGGGALADAVHPPELATRLAPLVRRPADLSAAELAPFVAVEAAELEQPLAFDDPLGHLRWALSSAESHRAIAADLWRRDRPDLLLAYVEGTDSVSHLFGHLFRAGPLAGELAVQQRRFGHAVEAMYAWADRLVGELVAMMDERTTLVVLSDHGFALGTLPDDPSVTRDLRRVSERFHRENGVLYLYGRGVRPGATLRDATLLDVAPTVLALLGIAPPRDMPGRVLTDGLLIADPPRLVASYEDTAAARAAAGADPAADPAILERLRSLGYLETASPRGDRNLAASLFQQGRYAEAERAYEALVAARPDDGALRASWAGALGALGRDDEALAELERAIAAAPLEPEGFHNRAVIRERQGRRAAAIADYRTALRYQPDYAPSQAALRRLGAAPEPTPADPALQRAAALAAEAAALARRGDYAGAMRALDAAERLAPRSAVVHHHRANVAFLLGDRAAAVAALQRALALEPDNALFRENLSRLQAPRATPGP